MRFLTANDEPGRHAPSWYAETLGDPQDRAPLRGETRADVCVIGAGYAGLSAALHLAEAGMSVRVLEANRVGWGASGRNGGQLGYGPRIDIRTYEAMVGADDAAKIWRIATGANALVKRLIAEHAIDCGLRPGCIDAAWRASDAVEEARFVEHVATRYAHPAIRALSREEIRAKVASDRYHGGAEDGEAGHLDPLAYAAGLAAAAERAGAIIHERSAVRSAEDGLARTEEGSVRADWVILACNGYLDDLAPEIAARVMPINNFIVATEPLGERAAALVPGGQCVADTRFVLNYFRISPEGRLLFGGGETYSQRFPADIRAFVRKPMLEIFPQLADVALTHGWGGTLAITRSRAPLFHRLSDRRLAICGWSGSGVHMATMGGAIAAEAVRGATDRWDVLARAAPKPFPGGARFRPALLALAMSWYALRDRL